MKTTQDTHRDLAACFVWKQVGLGFSQSGIKTDRGGVWMVHVTSLWRSREVQAEDGRVEAMDYIGPFYPNFTIFTVLCPRGISVFWLGL
jgi:hypothetical protein